MKPTGSVARTVAEINDLFPSIYKKYHARLVRASHGGCTLRTVHFLKSLDSLGSAGVKGAAEALGLSCSTVSTMAKRVEQRGLIRRGRARADERCVELNLTPAGRRLIRAVPLGLEPGLLTQALRRLPAADRKQLLEGLRKLDALEAPRPRKVEQIRRKRVDHS